MIFTKYGDSFGGNAMKMWMKVVIGIRKAEMPALGLWRRTIQGFDVDKQAG